MTKCKKGFKKVKNKCLRIKKKTNPKSIKKKNPFKMVGSWIGLIISLLIPLKVGFFGGYTYFPIGILMFYSPQLLIVPIIGFLIGWGIHIFLIKQKIIKNKVKKR